MKGTRSAAVLVVLALVAGALWWLTRESAQQMGGTADPDARAAIATRASLAPEAASQPQPVRSERAPESRASSATSRPGDLLKLSGRVIDEREQPVAGAEVIVLRNPALSVNMLDLEITKTLARAREQRTGTDGRFAFTLPRALPFELRVAAGGCANERIAECYAGQELTITMRAGAEIKGRVFWKADQRGIANVRVRGFMPGGRGDDMDGTTEADGSFAFRDVRAGEYYIEAVPPEGDLPDWRKLQVARGEVVTADFAIEAGETTRGRVTDAASGAPIIGAEVGHGWTYRRPVRSDARGEYVIEGYPSADGDELHVRADGYGRAQKKLVLASQERQLDFALVAAPSARGRVLAPDGKPFAGAYVAAVASDMDWSAGKHEQRTDWQATRSAHDGLFVCRSLRSDVRHVLYVRADGYATLVYDFPRRAEPGVIVDLGDVTLAQEAVLEGFVHEPDGRPVAKIEIALKGTNADRSRLVSEAGRTSLERNRELPAGGYVDSRGTKTDSRGVFQIGGLASGTYVLTVGRDWGPQLERADIVARAGEVTSLDLSFERGLVIAGRVVGPKIEDGVDLFVRADPKKVPGEWHESSARVKKDGTFVLEGLRAGTYRVELTCLRRADERDSPFSNALLDDVEAGTRDLEFRLEPAVFVTGAVLDEDGKPLAGAKVWVRYADGQGPRGSPIVSSDAEGRFKMKVLPARTVTLLGFVDEGEDALPLEMRKRRGKVEGVVAGAGDVVMKIERTK